MWETTVPYEQLGDWNLQPKRGLMMYGAIYIGWQTGTKARPLEVGREYAVEIWSDGGRGQMDLIGGAKLPACPNVR